MRENILLQMISAVRSFIDIAIIFCPLVLFWALFDQQVSLPSLSLSLPSLSSLYPLSILSTLSSQGSTWVLQARRMDGRVGSMYILPEQINFLNPLLILLLVPLFEMFLYPAAKKVSEERREEKTLSGGLCYSSSKDGCWRTPRCSLFRSSWMGSSEMAAHWRSIQRRLSQLAVNPSMATRPSESTAHVYGLSHSFRAHDSLGNPFPTSESLLKRREKRVCSDGEYWEVPVHKMAVCSFGDSSLPINFTNYDGKGIAVMKESE